VSTQKLSCPKTNKQSGYVLAGELWGHFNFSLLAMVCAWKEPWNPESHASFSSQFRNASRTLALCLGRQCGGGGTGSSTFPSEVVRSIISYLPREAWPEDQFFCWHHDCCVKQMAVQMFDEGFALKASPTTATATATAATTTTLSSSRKHITCKKCGIPRYCSKSCCENDKETHKQMCIEPPYCGVDQEHVAFCQSIADGSYKLSPTTTQQNEEAMDEDDNDDDDIDDDDDDGSWESMDSNEEQGNVVMNNRQAEPETLMQAVMRYMRSNRNKNN
jgi:hypothetical protein